MIGRWTKTKLSQKADKRQTVRTCLEMHWKWMVKNESKKSSIKYYCCVIIKMFLCARSIMKLLYIFSLLCLLHQERFLLIQWRSISLLSTRESFTKSATKKRGRKQLYRILHFLSQGNVTLVVFIHSLPKTLLVMFYLVLEDTIKLGKLYCLLHFK